MMRAPSRRRGFTFLEIMLVVLIIGILVAIVVPQFGGRTEQARRQATLTAIRNIALTIDTFEIDYGRYPEELAELIDPPEPPLGGEPQNYLDEVPLDPWRNEFIYVNPSEIPENRRSYDLYSMGPNGIDDRGGNDDIVPWRTDTEATL